MLDFGKHAAFVWTSYGIAGFVLLAMILWTWIDYRVQKRTLAALEERGVKRRSDALHGELDG